MLCKTPLSEPDLEATEAPSYPEVEATPEPEGPPALEIVLLCPPLKPISLREGVELRVGRTGADLNLPHNEVSRNHVLIRRKGDRVEVEDLGSRNGTFFNEQRLEGTSPFAAGDRLQVGPFELSLQGGTPSRSAVIADLSSTQAASAWTGNLAGGALSEVLRDIEFNHHSGTLEVRAGRESGRVDVLQGRPYGASYLELRDEEAILALLRLEAGRFLFHPSPQVTGSPLPSTITSLLLEAARQVDEDESAESGPIAEAPDDEAGAGWTLEG